MKTGRIIRTKYNIIAGILNRVVVLALGFLIRTFVIRFLGVEYIGLSGVVTSILNILNLAEVGFASAITFNLYKPVAEDNKEQICALLAFYRKAYRVIGYIILASGIALLPFLHVIINTDIPTDVNIVFVYLIYLSNTCIGYFLFGYINVLLIANQRNDVDSYLSILTFVIEYSIQAIVLVFYRNYYLYILVIPFTTIVMNVIRFWIVKKMFPAYKCKGVIDQETKKSVYENIKGLIIQKVCASTRNTFDSIFISAYLGLISAGLYSNYYYIISSVHGILVVLHSAMSAGIGNSIASETQEKNHQDMMKFVFIYAWISGVCTVCILCLYQPFMEIWAGKSNVLPFYDVLLFTLYFYAMTLGDIRGNYSAGAGLWWNERYRSLAEVIANIILNAVLGKFWGIPGIIGATLITIVFINFFYGSTILYKFYFTDFSVIQYFKAQGFYFVIMFIACFFSYLLTYWGRFDGFGGMIMIGLISLTIPNILFYLIYHRSKVFKEALSLLRTAIVAR